MSIARENSTSSTPWAKLKAAGQARSLRKKIQNLLTHDEFEIFVVDHYGRDFSHAATQDASYNKYVAEFLHWLTRKKGKDAYSVLERQLNEITIAKPDELETRSSSMTVGRNADSQTSTGLRKYKTLIFTGVKVVAFALILGVALRVVFSEKTERIGYEINMLPGSYGSSVTDEEIISSIRQVHKKLEGVKTLHKKLSFLPENDKLSYPETPNCFSSDTNCTEIYPYGKTVLLKIRYWLSSFLRYGVTSPTLDIKVDILSESNCRKSEEVSDECIIEAEVTVTGKLAKRDSLVLESSIVKGSPNNLSADLAIVLLKGILREWDIATQVDKSETTPDGFHRLAPAELLPTTINQFNEIVDAFNLLREGLDHAQCQGLSNNECVSLAANLLSPNTRNSDDLNRSSNEFAELGMALVELHTALKLARNFTSNYEIDIKLKSSQDYFHSASPDFIQQKLETREFLSQFDLLNLDHVELSNEYLASIGDYSCGMEAYRNAQWASAIERLGALDTGVFPYELADYMESTLLDARQYDHYYKAISNDDIVERLKSELIAHLRNQHATDLKKLALLKHVCMLGVSDSDNDLFGMIESVFRDSKTNRVRVEAVLHSAACSDAQAFPAGEHINFAISLMDETIDDGIFHESEMTWHQLLPSLISYYVRIEQFDSANDVALKAEYPGVWNLLEQSPEFIELRQTRQYETSVKTQQNRLRREYEEGDQSEWDHCVQASDFEG